MTLSITNKRDVITNIYTVGYSLHKVGGNGEGRTLKGFYTPLALRASRLPLSHVAILSWRGEQDLNL